MDIQEGDMEGYGGMGMGMGVDKVADCDSSDFQIWEGVRVWEVWGVGVGVGYGLGYVYGVKYRVDGAYLLSRLHLKSSSHTPFEHVHHQCRCQRLGKMRK